jgi:dihydrofolate synthase/folylpolyglutamate synthase
VADSPVDWLFGLAQFGIKFGLENIRAILAALDNPERSFRPVHIAGTNGKGSVTAMVESALRAGFRTGRYTSPHLLDLTERFAIDGQPVSQGELLDVVAAVRATVDRLRADGVLDVHPTFFEVTTAVAFELFRRHQVDVAVCEVGLGGRLDATNVLSPVACAITSIAFDHQQYLGDTLPAIAEEKAGIIKPQVPVVVGPVSPEVAEVFTIRATERAAPLVFALEGCEIGEPIRVEPGGQRFSLRTPGHDYGPIDLSLAGDHQVANAVVAVRLLEILDARGSRVSSDAIRHGLASVQWPGRLQHLHVGDRRELLLDAAHNEAGARALASYLHRLDGPRRPLVFAAMRDKDIAAMVSVLAPAVASFVVTRASNPRSADPSDLAAAVRQLTPTPVTVVESLDEALGHAWSESPRIVVAGSIFLLADVVKKLGAS